MKIIVLSVFFAGLIITLVEHQSRVMARVTNDVDHMRIAMINATNRGTMVHFDKGRHYFPGREFGSGKHIDPELCRLQATEGIRKSFRVNDISGKLWSLYIPRAEQESLLALERIKHEFKLTEGYFVFSGTGH